MFCCSPKVNRNYIIPSYLMDRLFLLGRHVILSKMDYISKNDRKLQFIESHIQQIFIDELYILGINNCETLVFIIRAWEVEPYFKNREVYELLEQGKKEGFESMYTKYVDRIPSCDVLFFYLTIKLIVAFEDSPYQPDFKHLLLPPNISSNIIHLMIKNTLVIERKIFPSRFCNIPKIMLNNKFIKMSSIVELEDKASLNKQLFP